MRWWLNRILLTVAVLALVEGVVYAMASWAFGIGRQIGDMEARATLQMLVAGLAAMTSASVALTVLLGWVLVVKSRRHAR